MLAGIAHSLASILVHIFWQCHHVQFQQPVYRFLYGVPLAGAPHAMQVYSAWAMLFGSWAVVFETLVHMLQVTCKESTLLGECDHHHGFWNCIAWCLWQWMMPLTGCMSSLPPVACQLHAEPPCST